MAKLIRRITTIEITGEGYRSMEVYSSRKKRRKVSRSLRPIERHHRRLLEASNAFTSELLNRHNRSNRKRRDGAYRDLGKNVTRAHRKAWKRISKIW